MNVLNYKMISKIILEIYPYNIRETEKSRLLDL